MLFLTPNQQRQSSKNIREKPLHKTDTVITGQQNLHNEQWFAITCRKQTETNLKYSRDVKTGHWISVATITTASRMQKSEITIQKNRDESYVVRLFKFYLLQNHS